MESLLQLSRSRFIFSFDRRRFARKIAIGITTAAIFALQFAPLAQATTYYWDTNGTVAGFGTAGGTWAAPTVGTATQGWSTDTTGVAATGASITTGTADGENFGTNTAGQGLATGTITVSGTVAGGNMTFGSQSGVITLSGGTISLGNSIITVNNASDIISSVLGGGATNALAKAGTGTLILTGVNTRTNTFNINAGTVQIGNAGTVGSLATGQAIVLTIASSTLAFNRTNTVTQGTDFSTAAITGLGGITQSGSGNLVLNAANTYTGTTAISAGTLTNGSATTFTNKGALSMSGTSFFDLGGFNATFTTVASVAGNTITNSSSSVAASGATTAGTPTGVLVDALTFSTAGQTIAAKITDGATRKTQIIINNANSATNLGGITNTTNTFTGGLVLANNASGTRLRITSLISGTPFGTGPIIIGTVATDKAQILMDTVTNNTLSNNIVINTALGTDATGALRIDTTGNILSGTITANAAAAFNVVGSVSVNGVISGAGGLTKTTGAGTVTLTNANNYSGTTTIQDNGGILSVTNSGGLGTSSVTIGSGTGNTVGGTLRLSNNIAITGTATINAAQSRTQISGGGFAHIENLSGNNSLTANLTIGGGGGAGFNILSTAGTLTLSGSLKNNSGLGRQFTFSGAGSTIVSGIVADGLTGTNTTALTQAGPGITTLTNVNTYTGQTTISGGTLSLGDGTATHDGTIASTSGITDNGTLIYNRFGNLSSGLAITGTGGVTKQGNGTQALTGTSDYSGATLVSAGTLRVDGSLTGTSGTTVSSGATLTGIGSVSNTVTVATGSAVLTGGDGTSGTLTLGALTFNGTGTINVGFLGNYTSAAAISTGALTIGTPGIGAITLNLSTVSPGSTGLYHLIQATSGLNTTDYTLGTQPNRTTASLQVNGNFLDYNITAISFPIWTGALSSEWSTNTLALPKNWTLSGGGGPTDYIQNDSVLFGDTATTFTVNIGNGNVSPASVTFSNNTNNYTLQGINGISGITGLTMNGTGTVTIANANTYTGATSISSGTVNLTGSLTGTAITVSGNGVLAESSTGVIGGSTGLTLSGSGTSTLSGVNTYTGVTTINNGATLQLGNGTASNDGTIASTSGITDNGTLVYNRNGSLSSSVVISGTGSVTKLGAGTQTLSGANIYSGGTTITTGTLAAASAGALGTGNITDNATLNLTAGAVTYTGLSNTGAGALSGNGIVNVTLSTGANTTILNGNYSSFTGTWNIGVGAAAGAGKVQMNGLDNAAATINVLANGTDYVTTGTHNASIFLNGGDTGESLGQLRLESGAEWAGPVTLASAITGAGDAFVGSNSGTGTISGQITQSGTQTLSKGGSGTIILTNSTNNYTGGTNVINGVLAAKGAVGVLPVGAVTLGATGTIQILNDASGTIAQGNAITFSAASTTGGIAVGNAGGATTGSTVAFGALNNGTTGNAFTSTINFTGANGYLQTYTSLGLSGLSGGGTTLNPTTTSVTILGNVTNQESGTLTAHFDTLTLSGTSTGNAINGIISDAAGSPTVGNGDTRIAKSGTSTWTFAGPNTYIGTTILTGGILSITNGSALGSTTSGTTQSGASELRISGGITTLAEALTINGGGINNAGALRNFSDDNTYAGTVTLAGQSRINSDSGTLTLSNATAVSATNQNLVVGGNGNITISGAIVTGSGFNAYDGAGTLTLSGANTYTGATSVTTGTISISGANGTAATSASYGIGSGGTLLLANTSLANNSDRLKDTGVVTMTGGTFNFSNNGGAVNYSETTGALTISSGTNTVSASQASPGQTSALTFASLTRTGGTVNFSGTGLGVDTRNEILFTTAPTLTGGAIGAWATYNGAGLAGYDNTLGVIAYTYSGLTDVQRLTPGTIANDSTANVRIIEGSGAPGNITLAATTTIINTLDQSTFGGTSAATIDAAGKTLATNGILVDNGAGALTIGTSVNSGTLQTATSGGDLILNNYSANALTINSVIANNTTASTVTLNGTGTVVLAGTNTYTGATSVNGGSLSLTGSLTGSNISTSGTAVFNESASGSIGGTGTTFTQGSSGTSILSGSNTYTGATNISAGTLRAGSATAFNSTSLLVMTGTSTLDLNGFNAAFTGSSTGVATATITDNSAGAGTSTITLANEGGTFAGLITNGATRSVAVAVSNGNVTFNLTNASNTFSGGLTLLDNAGGTRMAIGTAITTTGSPGAITSSNFGTGAITIGQAVTDKAGIYFTLANNTLANAIVFNTALGTDRAGIRSDVTGITLSGKITANLADATFSTNGTASFNLTGQVTGAKGLTLDNSFGTTLTVTLNNATANGNNYQGATNIAGTKGVLSLGAADQIPNGTSAGVVTNNGKLNLNGFNETINGLNGNGTLDGVSGTPTFTVGDNNANASFSGVIKNTAGTLALTKIGSGTQILGANTYSGLTTVSGGTLTVTGSSNVGGLTIANGTTFNYNPIAAGTLSLGSGALTFNGSSSTIGTAVGGTASQSVIATTGAATVNGTVTVNVYGITGVAPTAGVNNLITAASGLGSGFTLGNVFNASNFTVSGFTQSATAVSLTVTPQAALTSEYWVGGFSGNQWAASNGSTLSNWAGPNSGDPVTSLTPGTGTTVNFSATSPNTPTGQGSMTLGANMSILGLVSGDTNAVTLNNDGFTLTLGNGGITLNSGAGAVTLNPGVIFGAAQTWTNNSANSLTISGVVSGSTTLTTAGTGTVVLSGVNTYTGNTVISAGTLQIDGSGSLGSGSYNGTIANAGTLTYNSSATQTLSGAISGAGTLNKSGSGTLTLSSGTTAYTGATSLTNGTLVLVNTSGFASAVTVNPGTTLQMSPTGNNSMNSPGDVSLLGTLTYAPTGNSFQVFGTAAGNKIVTVSGGSSVINISPAGTFAASNGGLYLDGGLQGSSALTVNATKNGFGLVLRTAGTTYSGELTVNGNASTTPGTGSGLVIGASAGPSTPNLSSASLTINGTLELGNLNTGMGWASGAVSGTSVSIDALNGSGVVVANMATAGNTRTLIVGSNNGTGTFSGVIANGTNSTLSFTEAGTGTESLTGTNTYTGVTTVNSVATLQLGDGTTGHDGTIASTSGITDNGTLIYNRFGALSTDRMISGTGAVTISGPGSQTLTGANSYSGVTTINSGATLRLGDGTSGHDGTITSSSGITNNGTLIYNRFGSLSSSVVIGGTGTVIKSGAGTQTLSGINTYTGVTSIQAGTLALDSTGSINNSSLVDVSPGATFDVSAVSGYALAQTLSAKGAGTANVLGAVNAGAHTLDLKDGINIGTLALSSDLNLNGATLTFDLSATTSDLIALTGAATLAGTNTISVAPLTAATTLAVGSHAYTLVTAGSGLVSSNFALSSSSVTLNSTTYNFSLSGDATHEYLDVSAVSAAVNGIWNVNASGSWNTSSNWSGGVPGLSGSSAGNDTATFGAAATTVNPVVTLDGVSPVLKGITFNNAAHSYTIAQGTGGSLTLNGGASPSTIDVTNGSHTISAPLSLATNTNITLANAGSLTLSGAQAWSGHNVAVSGAGTVTISGTQTNTSPATFTVNTGVTANINTNSGAGLSLVNSGTTNLKSSQNLGGVTINSGAHTNITTNTALPVATGPSVVVTPTLTIASHVVSGNTVWDGYLDLANNKLVVQTGGLSGTALQDAVKQVASQVKSGYNLANGSSTLWMGTGIGSSSAAADTRRIVGLAVFQNNTKSFGSLDGTVSDGTGNAFITSFGTATVAKNDTLVKFTYFGDTDLDGVITAGDYANIDLAFAHQQTLGPQTGWANGDFDYDGSITAADYSLMDSAFAAQSGALSGEVHTLGSLGGSPVSVTAVPEPSTWLLGLMGIIGLLAMARRRKLQIAK